ncbi:MAG: hypothetical protein ABI425_02100 [Patescibacteria group bacterium]
MEDKYQKIMNRRKKLPHAYAEKVGLSTAIVDADVIKEEHGRLLFTAIVQDYQKGIISIEDLSFLCQEMWLKCRGFAATLLEGADISFNIRWGPESACAALRVLIDEFGKEWVMPAADNYK